MKKVLYLLLLFFIPVILKSQVVTEKTIFKNEQITNIDPYSFKFDDKTGTILYMQYDSTKTPSNSIISNKGNSALYEYIDYYSAVFDSDGNYYTVAYNKATDSTYTYFLLKNGKQELQFDFINSEIAEKNGAVYFMCTDKGKSFITSYDIGTGQSTKGNPYDEIILCQYDKIPYTSEPVGRIGFAKNGKPFYIAKLNNQAFVVIGNEEQKHFADIEAYNFITDKNGNFAYTAKDTGSFMNPGGSFVVYGNKQFKPFYYVYNLVLDTKGNICYIGTDYAEDLSPQKIMLGDKVLSKTYSGGLYNLGFTADNKMYFIASEKKKNSDEYESFVVFDGKEGKKFQSIFTVMVLPNNELLYTAQKSDEKSYVINGDDEIYIKQKSIMSAEVLQNGDLAYVGVNYGDYEKKIKDKYYANINGKEFGPYDGMQSVNYETQNYFLSDKNGNYAYIINNIRNESDYFTTVFWKNGKSEEFDFVQDVSMYKGKVLYTGSKLYDRENYLSKYRIYHGNKAISPEYDGINNFKFDDKTGVASFIVTKGAELVKVEIKF
jgi:hypothetical protein